MKESSLNSRPCLTRCVVFLASQNLLSVVRSLIPLPRHDSQQEDYPLVLVVCGEYTPVSLTLHLLETTATFCDTCRSPLGLKEYFVFTCESVIPRVRETPVSGKLR